MILISRTNFARLRAALAGLMLSIVSFSVLPAAALALSPDRLELAPTDKVFWKGKSNENYLILNVFAHEAKTKALDKAAENAIYLNTALVEGARLFERPEHGQLTSLSVLLVKMKDMSEYGTGENNWVQVGTATLVKGADKVELKDVKLEGALPTPLPAVAFPFNEVSETTTASALRFLIPETIYMVAGTPQDLYYEDLIAVKDADEYKFIATGDALGFGKLKRRGLSFHPTEANAGKHVLAIEVTDWDGKKIVSGKANVVVVPANAGSVSPPAVPIRILVFGHSLPSMYWPGYLADFLAGPGNPPVSFVGGIKYWYGPVPDSVNKPPLDTMYHQASPGYSVKALLSLYSDKPPANPNMPSQSPLLFKDGDAPPKIDMQRYLKETLHGKPPHYFVLNLGDNDTFDLNPDEAGSPIETEFIVNMNTFLDHLREIAPKATIGIVLPNTYNATERSFLTNYGPKFPRWKQIQNRQRYIEIMTSIAKKRGDLSIIPSNLVVDGVDGMPQNSGTHFNQDGARQFAGATYAWLKAQFAAGEVSAKPAAPAKAAPKAATANGPDKDAKTAGPSAQPEAPKKGWFARLKSYFGR